MLNHAIPSDPYDRAAEIDADTDRVVELFLDEAIFLEKKGRGNGHLEMIDIAVKAMNAWPVFEKMLSGLPVTRTEEATLPTLFQALKPRMLERDVLVRQAAEMECAA